MKPSESSRPKILRAATAIASEYGYIGTTISKISKTTGLPSSSIYWFFGDKDTLMAEVIDYCYRRWLSSLSPSARRPSDIGDAIRFALQARNRASARQPDFLRIGHMLLLESRDTESAAKQRIQAIRLELLRTTADWLRTFLSPDEEATLADDLAYLMIAAQDGLFAARQRGERWAERHLVDLLVTTVETRVAREG